MDNERDIKVYKKLSFVRFRKKGYSIKESYEFANIKKSTAYNIEDDWAENGYSGLLPKKRKVGSGRTPKLNKRQIQQLRKIIDNEDLTINEIVKLIKEKWDIEYTYSGVKNLLLTQFDVDIDDYLGYTPKVQQENDDNSEIILNVNIEDNNELNEILDYISIEKDAFCYKKLMFLVFEELKYSRENICKILSVTNETLETWRKQWDTGGYEALKKKKGQGRKAKLSDDDWEKFRKVMSKRDDWRLFELEYEFNNLFGFNYSSAYFAQVLKRKLNAHCSRPYTKDYRQSNYNKQIFNLNLHRSMHNHKT